MATIVPTIQQTKVRDELSQVFKDQHELHSKIQPRKGVGKWGEILFIYQQSYKKRKGKYRKL